MIADSDLTTLRIAVDGPVLTEGDPDFTAYAGGYNVAVVHRPDVIVGATSVADVIATIRWAAGRHLPVAVQATGHGVTERMVDGVLINTRRMQGVQVDPDRGIARVAAGVKWKALLAQTVPHGLVGLCGSSSDVGIVGFTLGGGLPLLGRALRIRGGSGARDRGRDTRRSDSNGRCGARVGAVRGAPRRQGQFRRRHGDRVRACTRCPTSTAGA